MERISANTEQSSNAALNPSRYPKPKNLPMLDLQALEKLNDDSKELNVMLQEINSLLDTKCSSIEGMKDVTERISKSFGLYQALIEELEEEGEFR